MDWLSVVPLKKQVTNLCIIKNLILLSCKKKNTEWSHLEILLNTEVTTQVFKTNLSWWWYLKLNKNLFKLFSPGLLNRDIEIISKSVMLKRDPSCWSSLWCYFLAYEFFTNRPMDGCYFFKDIFIINFIPGAKYVYWLTELKYWWFIISVHCTPMQNIDWSWGCY